MLQERLIWNLKIMLIDDHLNLQGASPLAFLGVEKMGERFVDLSAPYDIENEPIDEGYC